LKHYFIYLLDDRGYLYDSRIPPLYHGGCNMCRDHNCDYNHIISCIENLYSLDVHQFFHRSVANHDYDLELELHNYNTRLIKSYRLLTQIKRILENKPIQTLTLIKRILE